ncbi:MAG: DUF4010 domain-containing protein [Chlorobi bacterium]|nr:DUF4010 domain-containing protein [Chlorobiota bacterium]
MNFSEHIPADFINFTLVFVFSLLIGLEQRIHHSDDDKHQLFGTDRTFTLIGILGFILYIISPDNLFPFLTGGVSLFILLTVSYYQKIVKTGEFGLTTVVIAMITYTLTPLIYLHSKWLVLLVFVSILILTEIKKNLKHFANKFGQDEFLTFAKFIVLAGIILPLLPNKPISETVSLSLYNIWLAIVAVSSISYISYILKKFVFPNSGILLTAVLGGLYSSTATTIILAKKSKEEKSAFKVTAAIIVATSMMYLRLELLAFIFNPPIAIKLIPYFGILTLVTALITYIFYSKKSETKISIKRKEEHKNPLEFKTALIFGLLFAFFSVLTDFVVKKYGDSGIDILSLIVGVTDIDPFVLNLFQNGLKTLSIDLIVKAVLLATASNNILKMIYALILGSKTLRKPILIGFLITIIVSFGAVGFMILT